jgi:hypothetical protein
MIGDTLIFHTQSDVDEPENWPVLRPDSESRTQPLLKAESIYPPLLRIGDPDLHIVTICKLSENFNCNARAVIASNRAEWIVTETAGYLWTAAPRYNVWYHKSRQTPERNQPNTLYRFPIETEQIEAVMLDAELPSRFAFEVRDERVLALVSQDYELALLELPLAELSEAPEQVSAAKFTSLPGEDADEMRFTENHLIYSNFSYVKNADQVFVVDLETQLPTGLLTVPHAIDRLDRVGQNAVLIGRAEDSDDLNLSWLGLATSPVITDILTLANRVEAEGRAQALNMRVEENGAALLGLPTLTVDAKGNWDEEDGTDISFAHVSPFGQIRDLGPAQGDPSRVDPDYTCETSCVDWYGNARPFFIGERIFALIASELIELQAASGGFSERSRVNLSVTP